MIPQNIRLPKRRIEHILKKGRRLINGIFSLKFILTGRESSRFCVIISAKTVSRAVGRNKIRRRIYEIVRVHPHLIKKNADIAIFCKPAIINKNFEQIQVNLIELLERVS